MTKEMAFLICGAYIVIMGFITFVAYGIDKAKAKKGRIRIPEKVLLSMSLLGGGIGGLLGMLLFRHKTRAEHWYFYAVNFLGIGVCIGLLALVQFVIPF